MFLGKLVFAQLMDFLPLHTFRCCVVRYPSRYPTKTFSHLDQYLSMAFDLMTPKPGSFTIMDRGFLDFARLYRLTQAGAFFVTRPKSNTVFQRVYSQSVNKTTGLRFDQSIQLTGVTSADDYPQFLRCICFYDEENDKRLRFFTNNFELPALTIAQLYKCRWQVELFFKWIKQHLRIKAFFGTNKNAVKTQIWIAISIYVLVAIVKKRLGVEASLYTILQILSLTLFEKMPLDQLLNNTALQSLETANLSQLNLFDYLPDSSDVIAINTINVGG